MPTHTLSNISFSTPVWSPFETPPNGNMPSMFTVGGLLPFSQDNFVDASAFTRRRGVVWVDDGAIPAAVTINSVALNATHVEVHGTSVLQNFHPLCGYEAQVPDGSSFNSQGYDGHVGGYAPQGAGATWTSTSFIKAWDSSSFTRADIFSLLWWVGATVDFSDPVGDPAHYGTYTVSALTLTVAYTVIPTTTITVTGSGGAKVGGIGTYVLTKGVTGQGGIQVTGTNSPWFYGIGAPLELHGDQWGLMEFSIKPRPEDQS